VVDGVNVEYRRATGRSPGHRPARSTSTTRRQRLLAVNQFTVVENRRERGRTSCFSSRPALGVVELKNPADENATIWSAFQPASNLQAVYPVVVRLQRGPGHPDGFEARIGT
jgi:type I restriction enzyme R subunit